MKRKTVGQRLKEIMEKRGLKQVDIIEAAKPFFTDKVKISKTDLSQYVNDKAQPRSDKLYILSKGLNVPEQWLLGFDDDNSSSTSPHSDINEDSRRPKVKSLARRMDKLSDNDLDLINDLLDKFDN